MSHIETEVSSCRSHRRNVALGAALAILLGLSEGCTGLHARGPQPATLAMDPHPEPAQYVLNSGDVISVKFYYNSELNEDLAIRPDGKITMQLIGEVPAAGRTPAQLSSELTNLYKGELVAPTVNVIVRKFGSQRIYISGEVGKQGTVALAQGMTLYEAIQKAGGLLDTARRSQVLLIRRQPDGHAAGAAIDVRPIESGEAPDLDVPLRPLDVVFVPKSEIANVNVFVDQYVRKNLPQIPFAIPLY
ncbi:MAG TPA: polysaccharide biosynthesis/export family protein [Candidatus Acidoferrales bacterium]|nr:polysaccharide biosynthesis/export family protein [Candidatus Acidoferrales bacterium]